MVSLALCCVTLVTVLFPSVAGLVAGGSSPLDVSIVGAQITACVDAIVAWLALGFIPCLAASITGAVAFRREVRRLHKWKGSR